MQQRLISAVVVLGALSALALTACHRNASADDESFLPEDWDRLSSRLDPCLGTPPFVQAIESSVEWKLREPVGVIRLPSGLREVSGTKHGVRTWVGSDSTRFELAVTQREPGGLASGGGFVLENTCALPVAGHRALTARLRFDDTTASRSTYIADATVVVRQGVVLNASIESPSALTRERLLRAFSELDLTSR